MTVARTRTRHARRGNGVGMMVTLALHVGVLAAVGIAHGQPQPPLIEPRDFVTAELVKLGKPRDKFWLPRKVVPPKETAPEPTLKISEDPNAKAAPKEAPRPEDPKIAKDVKRALTRARMFKEEQLPEEPDEGSATGSKLGISNRAVGDQYQATVIGLLHQNYNLPAGIAPDQIQTPPEIRFHIKPDGTLTDIKLIKPSGNSFVDDACVQSAELTRRVPPPPPGVPGMRISCE